MNAMLSKVIIENNPYMFVRELEKAIKDGYDVCYDDARAPSINGWTLACCLTKDEPEQENIGLEIVKPKAGRPAKQQGV